MDKQQCKINTAHILRQIIRERNNPLSIFREAISNAYDADATDMKIIVERGNNGKTYVAFYDNGTGMTYLELCDFFNVGYSRKQKDKIGEKGLGTKLFFNSDKIIVETRSDREGDLTGRLDSPLSSLKKGDIPKFKIKKRNDELSSNYATKILLKNVSIPNEREIFWGNNLENYLIWKTVAGSFEHYFLKRKSFEVKVEIVNYGKRKSSVISGHLFPETNICDTPENFAYRFDPFEFDIKVGEKTSKVQIMGAIAGADAHIVKNKQIKKQYKGFFLCKDYFIVRDINQEIFGGGTGEWQNMHILVNCQDIELSMGREGFIERGEGTVFNELIEAIKVFKNCIVKGQPFEYNGRLLEQTKNFAGHGYSQLKYLKENKNIKNIKCARSLRLLQIQDNKRLADRNKSFMIYEPNNRISTFSLFLESLSKQLITDTFTIYDITFEDKNISLLMKKTNEDTKPLFYAIEHILTKNSFYRLKDKYQGIICWEKDNFNIKNSKDVEDIIILKDFLR